MSVDVSVIIPFCERNELLDRAVRSVEKALAASPDLVGEILPVDDTAREGVSRARNRGMAKAQGEWIVFVDADDELREDFFTEVLLPYHKDETCDLITCGFETVAAGTQEIRGMEDQAENTRLSGYSFIENRLLRRDTHVWAKAIRRSAIGTTAFQEGLTIGEDMLFLADLALLAGKKRSVIVSAGIGYRYYVNPAGAMEKPYDPSFLDELRCWELLEEKLDPVKQALTPYAFAALGGIRVRSAMLLAVKVARLPEDERKTPDNRAAVERARGIVREMLRRNGVFAGLDMRDKVRAILLRRFPRRFLSMAANPALRENRE
ncbi:MAG: glycosyltransferase [Lachnospiraceae bacterium]|nr:glycosyltransferase [Lachnospiraceae bacterium]